MVGAIRADLSGGHPVISLVLVGFVAAQALPPAPTPRPDLSSADAQSLARKLEAIEQRAQAAKKPPAKTVVVTENELNSYLNLAMPPKLPQGISDVEFRLGRERVEARGRVDLLGGRVELKGRLPNKDGVASIELDEVRVGGVPLPVALVAQVVATFTRTPSKPQGFDIRSPFALPYSLKRVRLEPGRALLDF